MEKKKIDGEGATRLVECNVKGAKTVEDARGLAKEIICSSLVKAAMFGSDANFGRFLCAMGYSGIDFDLGFGCRRICCLRRRKNACG